MQIYVHCVVCRHEHNYFLESFKNTSIITNEWKSRENKKGIKFNSWPGVMNVFLDDMPEVPLACKVTDF